MKIALFGCALLGLAAAEASAQNAPVQYDVRFPNAVHHEAQITATWRDVGAAPLRVQMSRSSPGRYAIHEFAKNVYSVWAKDGQGRDLTLTRTDPYGWTVAGHDGTVTVGYTLYGDRADGTYSQIDATHAHLNMPATFLWAEGLDERPIGVTFHPYEPDWKIATQLAPTAAPNRFTAPNLQYFMDSPTELSDHMLREWRVADKDRIATIRIALHHQGSAADADRYAEMAKKVVTEHIKLFGDAPNFDYGSYTFIADYLPYASGDGMEHRNSTILSNTRSLQEADFSQLGTLSHEFFHAWNVERLRPAELEPFDFTQANPTPSLWFAEGFTNYYGPLMIRRAGESTIDQFLANMGGAVNAIVNTPARAYGSPQEMSLRAPFVDAAESIDPVNPNIFASYYTWGQVIALGLDLSLRQRFPGVTLDDYMRHLWKTHGVPERPYTTADLQAGLAQVTGDPAFASAFFDRSIRGSALPEFAPLLAQAGLTLRPRNPGAVWLGPVQLEAAEGGVMLADNSVPNTPLYAAGLERGDRILSLGGAPIADADAWTAALGRAKPGDSAEIRFVQRGRPRTARLTFAADPALEIVRAETAGQPLTPAQRAFRTAWLGPDTTD